MLFKANFLDTTAPTDAGRIIAYEEPADEADNDKALPASDAPGRKDSAAAARDEGSAAKRKEDGPTGSLALIEHSASNTFTTSDNLEQFYTIVPGKVNNRISGRRASKYANATAQSIFTCLQLNPPLYLSYPSFIAHSSSA